MISVDDYLLPENVILPLEACLHNGLHLFFVRRVLTYDIWYFFTMIGHEVVVLSEDCTHNIVRSICLDLKWFFHIK
jgi:hypothetical protein